MESEAGERHAALVANGQDGSQRLCENLALKKRARLMDSVSVHRVESENDRR